MAEGPPPEPNSWIRCCIHKVWIFQSDYMPERQQQTAFSTSIFPQPQDQRRNWIVNALKAFLREPLITNAKSLALAALGCERTQVGAHTVARHENKIKFKVIGNYRANLEPMK